MSKPPPIRRWQFSLRAILLLMTVLAAITAFAANQPELAIIIALCTLWVLFESGVIIQFVAYLAEPKVFARHPLLATIVWFTVGLTSLAVSGCYLWLLFRPKYVSSFLLQLTAAIVFGGIGIYCIRLLWKSFQPPTDSEPAHSAEQSPRS